MLRLPIAFQALEIEIRPVLTYLRGKTLNAGCGNRDISESLLRHHATTVVNCDRQTSIPGAIICDLQDIPLENESFDSIFCNAVLEHVPSDDAVVAELRRLLKPGGFLVICVPFLQPYHPIPWTDYRRYTREGLIELAAYHAFEVLQVLPVHSIAQVLGWISWAYLVEKRLYAQQLIFWPLLWVWSRWSQQTDFSLVGNASGLQIVLQKS
jgi:SAM-dependent methyltransferase